MATVGTADAGIASRSIEPRAIIDEQTIDVKHLRERYVDELAVGYIADTDESGLSLRLVDRFLEAVQAS